MKTPTHADLIEKARLLHVELGFVLAEIAGMGEEKPRIEPMRAEINLGDRVKIIDESEGFYGRSGIVTSTLFCNDETTLGITLSRLLVVNRRPEQVELVSPAPSPTPERPLKIEHGYIRLGPLDAPDCNSIPRVVTRTPEPTPEWHLQVDGRTVYVEPAAPAFSPSDDDEALAARLARKPVLVPTLAVSRDNEAAAIARLAITDGYGNPKGIHQRGRGA